MLIYSNSSNGTENNCVQFLIDGTSVTPAEEGSAIRYVFPEGSVSSKRVTFKTRISDEAYYDNAEQSVINKADLLNSQDVIVKDGQTTVKFNPPKWIEKTGKSSEEGSTGIYDPTNRTITWYITANEAGTADPANQKIHWTVTVDTRGQNILNLKVYDLLVYGSSTSGLNIGTVSGIPGGVIPTDLTPRDNQKYAGNFVGAGLSIAVHPIEQDGEWVADLLEITGFSTIDLNTFTFDSQIVNPNIFAGNITTTVTNTASLFSANTRLNAVTANLIFWPVCRNFLQ